MKKLIDILVCVLLVTIIYTLSKVAYHFDDVKPLPAARVYTA